jgi:hypothetical protein
MKTNGITYDENNLPLAKGSWSQTIAYLISDIKNKQEGFLNQVLSSGSTVTIVTTEVLPRQTHVELYNPFPNIKPIKIEAKRVIVQFPPRVIHKPMLEIYERCCGTYESYKNTEFENCKKRVDYCYKKVNEERGMVTMNDMTMARIKLLDCGCSVPLNKYISDRLPKVDIYK